MVVFTFPSAYINLAIVERRTEAAFVLLAKTRKLKLRPIQYTPRFKIQFTQINYLRFICLTSWPCRHVIVGGGSGVYSIKHVKFIVLPTSMNKSGPLKISVTASVKHRSTSELQLQSISLAQDTYL